MVGAVGDVGVGEEEEFLGGGGDALVDGPELAGPAGRAGAAGEDGQAAMRVR